MSIKLQVSGAKIDLADELEDQFRKDARAAVKRSAEHFRERVQAKLRRRKGPEASAPGEPPAEQSGELARSWKILPVRASGRSVTSGVYSDHPGAARLEYGKVDRRGIRTLPRPYLEPAERAAEPVVVEILDRLVRE